MLCEESETVTLGVGVGSGSGSSLPPQEVRVAAKPQQTMRKPHPWPLPRREGKPYPWPLPRREGKRENDFMRFWMVILRV
jgi:hypothetical protein